MTSVDDLTHDLLKVVPAIMRAIRKKWKKGQICGVSDSQFHILMFIKNNPGTSLLETAQHLGQTSPSASASVDELVLKELVCREPSVEDRRKITLTISEQGQKTLQEIFALSQRELTETLAPLTDDERQIVSRALQLLEPLFSAQKDSE